MSNRIAIIDGKPTLSMNGRPKNGHAQNGHSQQTPFQEKRAEAAVAMLTYDAARTGTDLDGHWAHADSLDADSANSPQVRRNLRNRSRYETGSNGCYAGSLKTHVDLFIGNESGPSLRMLTGNRDFNQATEKAWFAWTQQIQLHRKLRCMFHARVQDGEVFGLLINNPELPDVQLDLLLIEADQVQSAIMSLTDANEVDGVHFDDSNNIVSYDVLPQHPGSGSAFLAIESISVPAKQVIHWFKLERPSAHRGKPDMTSTLNVGATNRRMREATVTSVESAASIAALIHSQLSPAGGDEPDPVAPFKPFQIPRRSGLTLPMGWDADQMEAKHPNASYGEFHRQQLSEMTSPIGQPYNVAAHDSSTYSFASGKLDTLAYRAALNIERGDCNTLVLDRLFAEWFREWTILRAGETFTPNHQWDWPLHPVIDAPAEASAIDTKLKNGTLQLRQAYSDAGQDYEDQLVIQAEDTFGEANDQTIAKCRQINVLKNTPQPALPFVAQLLGIESAQQGQQQRDIVEAIQKIYLGVGSVVSPDEARAILNTYGANLKVPGPANPRPQGSSKAQPLQGAD